ncbi:MAG: EAL domain-containing protein [Oscillospiraceae bacterium]|nr:EAL domain-containing protein [Oscillospiraceae bacterium]
MRKGTKRQIAVSACIPVLMFIAIRSIAYTAAHFGQTAFAYILEFLILAACCGAAAVLITLYLRSIRDRRRFKSMSDAVDKMSVFAVIWDRQRRQFYANNTFRDATHYTIEDLYDKKYMDRIFPEDAFSDDDEKFRAFLECPVERNIQCRTGGAVNALWSTSVMYVRLDGTEVMMSLSPNMNEQIRMKNELIEYSHRLEESERRYTIATEMSGVGLLLKSDKRDDYFVSEQLAVLFGIGTEDAYLDEDTLRSIIHPDDVHKFRVFAHHHMVMDDVRSIEFRAKSADGDYHWYELLYRRIYSDNVTLTGGAVIDISIEKEKDSIIEKMAYIDDVTQINNRNRFMMIGAQVIDSMNLADEQYRSDYWLIVFDVNSFHTINDTCGYETGNDLLKKIAMIVMKNLPEGGLAARIGGDNFAVLMAYDGSDTLPAEFLQSVRKGVSKVRGGGLENHNITITAGYTLMSDDEHEEFAQVLEHAELALSIAVNTDTLNVRYDPAQKNKLNRSGMEKDIISALENNEFRLYYQPKISLTDGSLIGMEALIRWPRADGSMVMPGDFIPVAERSMLITRISEFVLNEACRQNREWQDKGFPPVTVSVNLTAIDFYKTNVMGMIQDAIDRSGLAPEYLDVELTESLALKDITHAIMQMQEMREYGIKISMDDFGTGYSSLSYIQQLPITLLKLDRSFIMYLDEDKISQEIVSAIIRIAKSKKIETIAEGVETNGQAEILRQSGCDYVQGYLFGRPMSAEDFEKFMKKHYERSEDVLG